MKEFIKTLSIGFIGLIIGYVMISVFITYPITLLILIGLLVSYVSGSFLEIIFIDMINKRKQKQEK